MEDTHFVCTGGCGGVAPMEKPCETESCPMHGHNMVPCSCTDGKHQNVLGGSAEATASL